MTKAQRVHGACPRSVKTRTQHFPVAAKGRTYKGRICKPVVNRSQLASLPKKVTVPGSRGSYNDLLSKKAVFVSQPEKGVAVFETESIGKGLRTTRPHKKNEVVISFEGETVYSLKVGKHNRKQLVFQVTDHQARILTNDRHTLYLLDWEKEGVEVGINVTNRSRWINSSGKQVGNVAVKGRVNPACNGWPKADDICALVVARKNIPSGSEVKFQYPFDEGCSYLQERTQPVVTQINKVMDDVDPEGIAYRKEHGWLHKDSSRIDLGVLLTRDDIFPELADLLRALQKDPGNESLIRQLFQFKDQPEAIDALILCMFYGGRFTVCRRRFYQVRDRLNNNHVPNTIHSSPTSPWTYVEVYRLIVNHHLVPAWQLPQIMPAEHLVEPVSQGNITDLIRFVDYEIRIGTPASQIAGLLNKKEVVVPACPQGFWDMDNLMSFCDQHGISAVADKGSCTSRQEGLWNRCRQEDHQALWKLFNRYLEQTERPPFCRLLKELNRKGVWWDGVGLKTNERIGVSHLKKFISRDSDQVRRTLWLSYLEKWLIKNAYNPNVTKMVNKSIKHKTNSDDFFGYIEKRLQKVRNVSEIARSLRDQKFKALPGSVNGWITTEDLYLHLCRKKPKLARILLSKAGPRLQRKLLALSKC